MPGHERRDGEPNAGGARGGLPARGRGPDRGRFDGDPHEPDGNVPARHQQEAQERLQQVSHLSSSRPHSLHYRLISDRGTYVYSFLDSKESCLQYST